MGPLRRIILHFCPILLLLFFFYLRLEPGNNGQDMCMRICQMRGASGLTACGLIILFRHLSIPIYTHCTRLVLNNSESKREDDEESSEPQPLDLRPEKLNSRWLCGSGGWEVGNGKVVAALKPHLPNPPSRTGSQHKAVVSVVNLRMKKGQGPNLGHAEYLLKINDVFSFSSIICVCQKSI